MKQEEILVRQILDRYQEIKTEVLPETSLKDLGLSSLAIISVIMDLEDELSFDCPTEQEQGIRKVQDLIDLAKRNL